MTAFAARSDSFYEYAAELGLPPDSLIRFEAANYYPQPKQLELHAAARLADDAGEPQHIGYGGALGGGKTHGAFAQIAIDDCQRFPNLKVLFLRKIGKYAKESIDDLRRTVLRSVTHEFKNNLIAFPNESRIILGSYQYEKDIDSYMSLEYDVILIEQAEQLSGSKVDLIKTRNRSSKGFRPRMYYTFNPGGVGHLYLKELFIKPYRSDSEEETKFIFANHADNSFLNDEYKDTLESLVGWQRRAWLEGDWDLAAGQFFENFRHELHIIKPEDEFDYKAAGCDFWCSLDYGFKHWTVAHLFTEYDGVIYCLDEFAARKQLISSNCEGIKEMLSRWELTTDDLINFCAGTDVFAKKGDTGECFADEFAKHGIFLRAANTSRRAGWGKILQLFGDEKQQIAPSLKISSRCEGLIERLPALVHNPNDPEDVLKVDCDEQGNGGDDHPDSFRYGVMNNNSLGVYI